MCQKKIYLIIGLLCFLIAAAIRINNNFTFAPAYGYDASGHLSYIYQLKEGWGIPLANEGWSTFHPPLYYFIAATLWNLMGKWAPCPLHILFRFISTLMNLGMALLAVLIIHIICPNNPPWQLLSFCFILFTPMHIYSSSMMGNEQITAFLISLGLLLIIQYYKSSKRSSIILASFISVLALLSKYTGILLFLTLVACVIYKIIFQPNHRRIHLTNLLLILLITFLLAGGFYWKNTALFGTPFPLSQSYSYVKGSMDKQPPGERKWADFFGFDLTLLIDPIVRKVGQKMPLFRSRYIWSLVYSNFWFESFSHFFILNYGKWRKKSGIILLFLGLIPTLLFVCEVGKESLLILQKKRDDQMVPLLMLLFFNFGTFIYFNINTPHYSAGKATYFLASSIPISLFMSRGMLSWMKKGKSYKVIGLIMTISLFLLSSLTFYLTYT